MSSRTLILSLNVPVERGDKRAIDMICLQADECPCIWQCRQRCVRNQDYQKNVVQGSVTGGKRLRLVVVAAILR